MSTSEENLYDAVCMYLLEGKYSDKETKNSKGYISDCVLPGHMLAIDTNSCITTENKQLYVNTVP